jgi:FKBP-type peptidyl-prolyl cis-trans isomerase FkpA
LRGFAAKGVDFSRGAEQFRAFYGTKPPGPFPNRASLPAMKFTSQVSAALASLSLLVAASAQDPVKFSVPGVSNTPAKTPATTPATTTPATTPAAAKFTNEQIAEAYGWIAGQQLGLRQLEFSKAEIEAMARGMIAMAAGGQPNFDPQAMEPELQAFMAKKAEAFEGKRQAYLTQLRTKNMAENLAFFTKLKENKNVVELPDGLRYEILKPATGPAPKPGQIATINYTGTFLNGEVFDSSVDRKEPIELPMTTATQENPNGTISGMVEGLSKIGVGGKAKLYIPPHLAYGDNGNQAIPPGATLIFEVEVVGVKDAPKTPAAK